MSGRNRGYGDRGGRGGRGGNQGPSRGRGVGRDGGGGRVDEQGYRGGRGGGGYRGNQERPNFKLIFEHVFQILQCLLV